MSIIACCAWVPRGAAKENPEKVELTKEDMQQLLKGTQLDLEYQEDEDEEGEESNEDEEWEDDDEEEDEDAEEQSPAPVAKEESEQKKQALAKARAMAKSVLSTQKSDAANDPSLAEYNLDNYDNEDSTMSLGDRLAGLALYASNEDDPYVVKDVDLESIEDFMVKPTDNLIIVGQTDEDCSRLDVYGYDETCNDLFMHHDIILSAYPFCVEWLDFDPGSEEPGNLVAVGGMSTQIEVWDVDIIDAVEPVFVLGEKKRDRKKIENAEGHSAEVLGLAWNKQQRNILASASADKTVKLWDLSTATCIRTYSHHKNKVQNVVWNPVEFSILLTGSFDKTVAVFDTKSPAAVARWKFKGDVECTIWNTFDPSTFIVSTDDGRVFMCDTKQPGSTIFTLQAHNKGVPALALSNHIPGCLATGSPDGTVKVWDLAGNKPQHIFTKEANVGAVYTVSFCTDAALVLCVGGEVNGLRVLDLSDVKSVVKRFSDREQLPVRVPIVKEPKSERWHERHANDGGADGDGDDDDDDVAVAAANDDDEEEEESWEDIVQEISTVPEYVREKAQQENEAYQQAQQQNRKKDFKVKHFYSK